MYKMEKDTFTALLPSSQAHERKKTRQKDETKNYQNRGNQKSLRTLLLIMISNSNWTEWSTIQGVIARVISKSDEREARGRFEITSTITP